MARTRHILCLALLVSALVPAAAVAAPGHGHVGARSGAVRRLHLDARPHLALARCDGVRSLTDLDPPQRIALDAATAAAHPDWVLKDAAATPLYVGSSPAADFGNPAYRAWWIAQVSARAVGAAGVIRR